MLTFCKLIFMVNFFVFPISAGWLSYRKIRGKTAGRYFRMMVMSLIMLMISWLGIYVNETPENRAKTLENIENAWTFEE